MENIFFTPPPFERIAWEHKETILQQIEQWDSSGHAVRCSQRAEDAEGDKTMLEVCESNRDNLKWSTVCAVWWWPPVEEILFDLGMAFEMKKRIHLASGPMRTKNGTYTNLLRDRHDPVLVEKVVWARKEWDRNSMYYTERYRRKFHAFQFAPGEGHTAEPGLKKHYKCRCGGQYGKVLQIDLIEGRGHLSAKERPWEFFEDGGYEPEWKCRRCQNLLSEEE